MPLVDLNIRDDDDGYIGPSKPISQAPCIYLSAAQVKALGITEPPRAGTKLNLQGVCIVESVTELIDGDMDDPDVKLCLILEHAEISGTGTSDAAASLGLYGNGQ